SIARIDPAVITVSMRVVRIKSASGSCSCARTSWVRTRLLIAFFMAALSFLESTPMIPSGRKGRHSTFHSYRDIPFSSAFWSESGNLGRSHLHHWLISQSWTSVSPAIRNAGWNLIPISADFNRWMGFAQNWGALQAALANASVVGVAGTYAGGSALRLQ